MINGGLLLLPIALENQVFNIGIKINLFNRSEFLSFGIGGQILGLPTTNYTPGICYGVATFGNSNSKFNILLGEAFSMNSKSTTASSLMLGFSGDLSLSGSVKFMTEIYYSPEWKVTPLVFGLRFYGKKLAGDIGMLYPLGEDLESVFGIPVVTLFYCF
jgi:hypothetical protein